MTHIPAHSYILFNTVWETEELQVLKGSHARVEELLSLTREASIFISCNSVASYVGYLRVDLLRHCRGDNRQSVAFVAIHLQLLHPLPV